MIEFESGWSGNRKELFIKQKVTSVNLFELYLLFRKYLTQSLIVNEPFKNTSSFTGVHLFHFHIFNFDGHFITVWFVRTSEKNKSLHFIPAYSDMASSSTTRLFRPR